MKYELERRPSTPERMWALPTEGLILATTDWLRSDEPALLLIEENRMTEDLLSDHRWQVIFVGRGDKVLEFPRDLGPIKNFPEIEGFILFSGGEDTVEQLMDMADAERESKSLRNLLKTKAEASTLIQDAIRLEEQKQVFIKRNERTLRAQYGIVSEKKLF